MKKTEKPKKVYKIKNKNILKLEKFLKKLKDDNGTN